MVNNLIWFLLYGPGVRPKLQIMIINNSGSI